MLLDWLDIVTVAEGKLFSQSYVNIVQLADAGKANLSYWGQCSVLAMRPR